MCIFRLKQVPFVSAPFFIPFGVTPTGFHNLTEPEVGKQNTLGGDVFINLLKDRLRIGLGVRNFDDASETAFFYSNL